MFMGGDLGSDEPEDELVERVAQLAVELLAEARKLGDVTIIKSAELAAYAAGRALAQSIEHRDPEN